MLAKCILCLCLAQAALAQVVYDAYFGKPISETRRGQLASLNATGPCTVAVQPCRHAEGRRVDGSCVNPRHPSRGTTATPFLRMLPAKYGPGTDPKSVPVHTSSTHSRALRESQPSPATISKGRKRPGSQRYRKSRLLSEHAQLLSPTHFESKGNTLRPARNGSDLPSARALRTRLLSDGYEEGHDFSTLATHVLVFSAADTVDLTVLLRYAVTTDCCLGNIPNRVNPQCIPITVAQDDPYLRRTGIRCMNLTREPTFQELGCIPNTLPAERYSLQTPLEDLSTIYGFTSERERQIRTFVGGLLRTEERNGVERPPGTAPFCYNNRRPVEAACYEFGDAYDGNLLVGIFLTAMWLYRDHNRLARGLAKVNPCWDDQKLFETARQINIAQWQYMLYYEVMADVLGRKHALEAGIIYDTHGYVNDFDDSYKPGVFHEYTIGTRWFHTLQDGRTDLYSNKGKYLGTRTTVDDSMRSGILELNNTEADLTQGALRQPAAKLDTVIDPDLAERVLTEFQSAADLPAIDMMRGRDAGLPPYNEYRKICGMPVAHKFEDFADTIYPDKLEQMRRIYADVDDVELMTAIYSERLLKGSHVGPTLFCIMATNLVQWRKADRYFFEHGDIPTALTLPQLNEVRKTSLARLLCDSGDGVDWIQPRAMRNAGLGNEMVPCKLIPGIDLNQWRDERCPGADEEKKKDENDKDDKYEDNVNIWMPHDDWNGYDYRK